MLVTILLIAESLRIVCKRICRAQHRADEDYPATSIGGEKYLNRIYTFRAINVAVLENVYFVFLFLYKLCRLQKWLN